MTNFLRTLPDKVVILLFIAVGALLGLAGYTVSASNVTSYLTDDPSACTNCHVMSSYYASWSRSSHAMRTNCNDCHVPRQSVFRKYYFKAMDGSYHAAVFTAKAEPDVIRPRTASADVIMENCVRCHEQLNTEFVKTGMISYTEATQGKGKACWDCHREVPHTRISNLASAPAALAPLPGQK